MTDSQASAAGALWGPPHLCAAQDSGQRDVVPLGGSLPHRGHRGPAGHVEGAGQPVQLAALHHNDQGLRQLGSRRTITIMYL